MYPYIGMIGGIGVGYSAGYSWQTVFNTFGALSIAAELFGLKYAVLLRIGVNVVGAAYTLLCDRLIDKIYAAWHRQESRNSVTYIIQIEL